MPRLDPAFPWVVTAVVLLSGVGLSVVLSLLLNNWIFLLLPIFLPFFLRGKGPGPGQRGVCPVCGYVQRDITESFCPRDGSRLR